MITKQKWKYFRKWFCTCDTLHMQTYLRVCLHVYMQSHTSHGTVWWSGKCNLLQQLELASELESGLQDITTGAGSGLLISMLEKLNWFYLTSLVNTGVIDVKVVGSVLEEKISFKILTFSFKLDSGSYIISIAKTTSKTIRALICSIKFFSWGCSVSL